jgi:hypothetical protein
MDKQRNQEVPTESPALNGPDYFSLVIEWEEEDPDAVAAGAPEASEPQIPTRQKDWDIVDEASDESFPASDPPAWGSYHASPSATTIAESALPVRVAPSRKFGSRLRQIVLAVMTLGTLLAWIQRLRRHRMRET